MNLISHCNKWVQIVPLFPDEEYGVWIHVHMYVYLLKLFPNDCFYNCCFHLEIQTSLCDPGPELIVCDEGHRIKNDSTNISQALKRIKTKYMKLMLNTIEPLSNSVECGYM